MSASPASSTWWPRALISSRALRFSDPTMLSYTSAVTIALDATPLTVSTGGVGRYTLELARALAAEYPDDQYWLLSDQLFHPSACARPIFTLGDRSAQSGRAQVVDVGAGSGNAAPRSRTVSRNRFFSSLSSAAAQRDDPARSLPVARSRVAAGGLACAAAHARLLRLGLATMVITPSEAVRRAAIERFRFRRIGWWRCRWRLPSSLTAGYAAFRRCAVLSVRRDAGAAQEHRAVDRSVARSAKAHDPRRSGVGRPGSRGLSGDR